MEEREGLAVLSQAGAGLQRAGGVSEVLGVGGGPARFLDAGEGEVHAGGRQRVLEGEVQHAGDDLPGEEAGGVGADAEGREKGGEGPRDGHRGEV